ncbi:MAG: hypothetical protein GXP51_03475 [Deltaproteobacteria bacterium]|nr:hypothetical protein [Deltaproteobacteria bacterium]
MQQAAEALSRLLRRPISIDVADVWMSDRGLPAETTVGTCLGIYLGVSGAIDGGLLLTLSESCGRWLSQQLLGAVTVEDLLAEPAGSTLKEVGNIIASAFLSSLDDQLDLCALPAPPVLIRATLAELLERCQPSRNEACLVVRTRLRGERTVADNLQAAIYLFPAAAAVESLLAQINRGGRE